jgi:hypothetical protein
MIGRGVPVAVVCLLGLAQAAVRAAEFPLGALDPQRVAWKELRFTARKLGLSATVDIRLDASAVEHFGADGRRRADTSSAPPLRSPEILLESTSHLPGRTFLARERVDPLEARAREIVDTEVGAKNHRKTYSLTGRGFLYDLLEPASRSETALAPEGWTRRTRTFAVYPKAFPPGAALTGPAGLLYAASAAGLTAPGDYLTMYVLVQTQVERVTVRVEGVEQVPLDFEEDSGGAINTVREQLSAVRLVARSQPLEPASASAFRIFGLEGDVEILWDPVRRIPVELTGKVKLLGHVEVRLASATLRRATAE